MGYKLKIKNILKILFIVAVIYLIFRFHKSNDKDRVEKLLVKVNTTNHIDSKNNDNDLNVPSITQTDQVSVIMNNDALPGMVENINNHCDKITDIDTSFLGLTETV